MAALPTAARVLKAVKTKPDTSTDIANRLILSQARVRACLRDLHAAKKIHISGFTGFNNRERIWAAGYEPDAVRRLSETAHARDMREARAAGGDQRAPYQPPEPGVVRTEWRFPIPFMHKDVS